MAKYPTWYINTIAGHRSSEKLVDAANLTVARAREKTRKFLTAVTLGKQSLEELRGGCRLIPGAFD